MELKDFIEKSLVEICMGIRGAQFKIKEEINNYPIAPAFMEGKSVIEKNGTSIDFDIAVKITNDQKSEVQGTGGTKGLIEVIGVSASISGSKVESEKNENSHRIKFSVPFYPQALNAKK